jgi:integrase
MSYNTRTYFGKYSAFLSYQNRHSSIMAGAIIERFLGHFPETASLNDFTVTDLGEYIDWRLSNGCTRPSLRLELTTLNRFWKYLIETLELKLYNPVSPYLPEFEKKKPRNKDGLLTLSEFKKLVSAAGPDYRQHLYAIAARRKSPIVISSSHSKKLFQLAVEKAGLRTMTIKDFRKTVKHGLWKLLIKDHMNLMFPPE